MKGLAGRLNDLMSALGGQSVVDADDQKVEAGDYGFRYLVRPTDRFKSARFL